MEYAKKTGWIEVICGSMFSGKTEELIRRMRRVQFAQRSLAIFKPKIDTRYSVEEVVSHDAKSIKSITVSCSAEILEHTLAGGVEVIGIDEAQFLDNGIIEVAQTLANQGVRVIIAGLDTDFRGIPFGPMPYLMAIAEYVTKEHAICVHCGDLANHSHRLTKSDKIVELGEKDIYEPVCRHCFNKLKKKNAD
ncbi:MAG: thymidine kinase [Bacteroidales bacterium]|nr:thymidine kinase [Candidatus Cacconaster equi]